MVQCPGAARVDRIPPWLSTAEWRLHYDAEGWRQVLDAGAAEHAWRQRIQEATLAGKPLAARNSSTGSLTTLPAIWKYDHGETLRFAGLRCVNIVPLGRNCPVSALNYRLSLARIISASPSTETPS
jgi:hypothetical protein